MSQWQITDGSFKGQTIHVAVPKKGVGFGMTGQSITSERRLQISERPQIDGADVEDFGRKPRTFQADLIFFGPDYRNDLAAFENLMNPAPPAENTTGILILPDMRDAVYAKYQRHTRTTSNESCTMVQVTWIEDRTGTQAATVIPLPANLPPGAGGAGPAGIASPSLLDKLNNLSASVTKATSTLNANSFVTGLSTLESSVVNVRVALNSVLNLPRNARTDLQNTVQRVNLELGSLGTAVAGIRTLTSDLSLAQAKGSPTRTNSTASAVDFAAVGVAAQTATVLADGTIARTTSAAPPVASYPSAAAQLTALADILADDAASLEAGSSGSTSDVSDAVLVIRNQITDLAQALQADPSTQVVSNRVTSLPEILFENGIGLDAIDYYRGLNPGLNDILNVPAFTVVNL